EPDHLVQLVLASGEHDDRDGILGAEAAAHLETIELRQHQVEDDEVDVLPCEAAEGLFAVTRVKHPKPFVLERIREELLNRLLVIDEQNRGGVVRGRFHVEMGACRSLVLLYRAPWLPPRQHRNGAARAEDRSSDPSMAGST